MSGRDLIALDCPPGAVKALASELHGYGILSAEPEWLSSAVWLSCGGSDYLATSSTRVLFDGYVARPLSIAPVDEFLRELRRDLRDISPRVAARQNGLDLPEPARPAPPDNLRSCPPGGYSTQVLFRRSGRASTVHRIGCAMLFTFAAGSSLLVGTDIGTLAMVVSEDSALIERYMADCEAIDADEYVKRCRG